MSNITEEGVVLHDGYGSYISSPPLPPVPSFPCIFDSSCTADARVCTQHKSVLFVNSITTGELFEIPYGKGENWLWYKQRITDRTGIPVDDIRLIYAGSERDGLIRHSGLSAQSTIHMLRRSSTRYGNEENTGAANIDKKT